MASTQLIINADDGNLTSGVIRGVLNAHDHGIVTSTTVFANFPLTNQLKVQFDRRPKLGVGLHLNITLGTPAAPVRDVRPLLAHGEFVKHAAEFFRAADKRVLSIEFKAQIEKFFNWRKQWPTHLDTHHHLHRYAPIFEVISDLAAGYRIPIRLTELVDLKVRERLEKCGVILADHLLIAPQFIKTNAKKGSSPWHDWGSKVQETSPVKRQEQTCFDKERLNRTLGDLPSGIVEIVTHPAEIDDALKKVSSFVEPRALELEALTQPGLISRLEQDDISLINYHALKIEK